MISCRYPSQNKGHGCSLVLMAFSPRSERPGLIKFISLRKKKKKKVMQVLSFPNCINLRWTLQVISPDLWFQHCPCPEKSETLLGKSHNCCQPLHFIELYSYFFSPGKQIYQCIQPPPNPDNAALPVTGKRRFFKTAAVVPPKIVNGWHYGGVKGPSSYSNAQSSGEVCMGKIVVRI